MAGLGWRWEEAEGAAEVEPRQDLEEHEAGLGVLTPQAALAASALHSSPHPRRMSGTTYHLYWGLPALGVSNKRTVGHFGARSTESRVVACRLE